MLPIGDSLKDTIRSEAKAAGIPTALKKDSQGVCFLGHIDIKDFLAHYTKLETGPILDTTGRIIGHHDGALIYTQGQRHSLHIETTEENRTPYYVVSKDIINNTVTVSKDRPEWTTQTDIHLTDCILRSNLAVGDVVEAQIRYRQNPFAVTIIDINNDGLIVSPLVTTEKPATAQSCVLYTGTICPWRWYYCVMPLQIAKADGSFEYFKVEKLRRSLRRSGATPDEVQMIVSKIETELYEGMKTQEIYRHAFNLLRQQKLPIAARYSLRRALFSLGPTGFPFELFLARLFTAEGYQTQTGIIIEGPLCHPRN